MLVRKNPTLLLGGLCLFALNSEKLHTVTARIQRIKCWGWEILSSMNAIKFTRKKENKKDSYCFVHKIRVKSLIPGTTVLRNSPNLGHVTGNLILIVIHVVLSLSDPPFPTLLPEYLFLFPRDLFL